MIALTPFDVGGKRISVTCTDAGYDHSTQLRISGSDLEMATTWNATQTFNSKGQPNDKDNDK